MKTSLKPIKAIQRLRLGTIMIGSALALALATPASAAPPLPHSAPTAIAVISPTAVWEGDTVTLDASSSHTNPCCTTLTYGWQQQAPNSPMLALIPDNKTVTVTFIAPTVPLPNLTLPVTFRVKVTDDLASGGDKNVNSAPVTTTVYASPGANAQPKDAHVPGGTVVTLMGSATRAQPGATFSYTWTAPAGITLSNIHAQQPTFTAPLSVPLAGQALTFTLVVTEHLAGLAHDQDSASDSVTINVDHVNQPPTAYASADPNSIVSMAEVDENTSVTLYGSGSDPDGDTLTFNWTQVGGPTVMLSDNTSTAPTFTAPDVSTAQGHIDLVFQLTTNDGSLNSGPSSVTIRVNNTNDPPVAVPVATPASAFEGDLVTLDGSGSNDPNMDSLTYTWEQTGGTHVALTSSGSNATFTAPTVSAQQGSITLDFQLTVSDGELSDTKPVSVTVSHVNQIPVADAGQDQIVPEGGDACLDGSGSYDPDGDTDFLIYAWVQMDGPAVVLDNASSSQPCFATPNVGPGGADLHFQLTVTDSHMASNSDTMLVHVNYVNHPPNPNAGIDQNVDEDDTVHLDGSGSSDPDGNPLYYAWSQVSGPTVAIIPDPMDPSKATFVAPQVFCGGDVVVMRLTVDDTYADGIRTDDVQITVANVNNPPTANAGGNQDVNESVLVNLHGDGSDLDAEEVASLTFEWEQISGDTVSLSGTGQNVSFTAPAIPGGDPNASVELGFRLTVRDGCGGTATDVKTVRVVNIAHDPTAVATGSGTANEGGATVQLDGSMSSDPDLDPLTYAWEQTDGPAVTLVYSPGDMDHIMPMFATPWVSANTPLKFKLTVSDPYGGTSSANVTVTVINSHTPPDASHARADVGVLWPPDHKMALVHILGIVNPNNDPVTIDSVSQDEPTNGLGDGDTPIDAIISGDSVQLRAERSGNGNGRVYHVCFTVHDPEQNAQGCVTVAVPKSKKTDVAVDGGSLYDSTH
jgi:REJ domain/Bacterial Ig domain